MTVSPQSIREFDTWQPGYGGKVVTVYQGGTTLLAALFLDVALTQPASNPQTLIDDGDGGGKFALPVYTTAAYSLAVDGADVTGIIPRPLTSLKDEQADYATVKSASGSNPRRLTDRADDFTLALDYGALGTSPDTNTNIITAAIGHVAAAGGGEVLLPGGDIPFTQLQLSTGVRLRGRGRGATRLFSVIGDKAVTINGQRAGLHSLTLDGVSLQANSVGVYAKNIDQIFMFDAEVKRFDKGVWLRAASRFAFSEFYVNGCATNVLLDGDTNSLEAGNTGVISNNRWVGGIVQGATTVGIKLNYVDAELLFNVFENVSFEANQTAIQIIGARFSQFPGCRWTGNTKNFDVSDGTVTANNPRDYVQGLHASGTMNGGSVNLAQTSYDVVFDEMDIKGVTFALTLPSTQLLLRDCVEDAAVTITGDGTKLVREYSTQHGATDGITTGNTPVVAWRTTLGDHEAIGFVVTALGVGKNNIEHGGFVVHGTAYRPGAQLQYKTMQSAFTVGQTVTGQTSKATGIILADANSGATGTLTIGSTVGAFLANEVITDGATGSAIAAAPATRQNVTIQNQVVTSTFASTAGLACTLVADVGDVEVQVTGLASKNIAWTVQVEMVRTS